MLNFFKTHAQVRQNFFKSSYQETEIKMILLTLRILESVIPTFSKVHAGFNKFHTKAAKKAQLKNGVPGKKFRTKVPAQRNMQLFNLNGLFCFINAGNAFEVDDIFFMHPHKQ